MPSENDETGNDKLRHKRPAAVLVLGDTNGGENNKETNSSDTENASPAMPIGPKDMRSVSEISMRVKSLWQTMDSELLLFVHQ